MNTTHEELTPRRIRTLRKALDFSEDLPLGLRMNLIDEFRGGAGDNPLSRVADEMVLQRCEQMSREIREVQEDTRKTFERLTSPPHFPGVFLDRIEDLPDMPRARVSIDGSVRVIRLDEGVDNLQPGEQVLVSSERNVIVARDQRTPGGDLAHFERLASNGMLVVGFRAEQLLCRPVNGLEPARLKPGDTLLIDPANRLAIDKVDDSMQTRLPFECEEVSDLRPSDVGGLSGQLDELLGILVLGMSHPDSARRYRLTGLTSILMSGPPGTGKTLIARVLAAEIKRRTGIDVRFISILPSGWKSEWVGKTERAIRETFAAIRRVARDGGFVVVFMDEVEGFGRTRGTSHGNAVVDDFTNSLLAELDGFQALENVALISASNRTDLIDPALRERLAGISIEIPRPKLDAARAIFSIHLRAEDPWTRTNHADCRGEAIQTALSILYGPGSEGNAVARIRFNDGSSRTINAADLISGRIIAQIGTAARRSAAIRNAKGDDGSITTEDVSAATEAAIDGMRTMLSRGNATSYLADLPQDLSIVAVEPIRPKPQSIRQYFAQETP